MDGEEHRDGVAEPRTTMATSGTMTSDPPRSLPSRPEAVAEVPHRGLTLQRGGRGRPRGSRGNFRGTIHTDLASTRPYLDGGSTDTTAAVMLPFQGAGRGRGRGQGRFRPSRGAFRGGRGRGSLTSTWSQPHFAPEQPSLAASFLHTRKASEHSDITDSNDAPQQSATETFEAELATVQVPFGPEHEVEHDLPVPSQPDASVMACAESIADLSLSPRVRRSSMSSERPSEHGPGMIDAPFSPARRWSHEHRHFDVPPWTPFPGPPYDALEPAPFLALGPSRLPPPPPPPPFTVWLPVPYLVYWGPEPFGAHPLFYDVPMVSPTPFHPEHSFCSH
ncbi:uncharacterized protein PAN0_001c0072 [Moesziomyces antarcticus]|uniref:Uncharacterized protein n=1 Tax=Pseudozyma antarctica TaxID=84753 RepID=A0A5C3FFC1_PSEA2|nr:uncharacterized protein PAN0_001c0072 [Moesziomyces antarcticus]GAK61877.1 hypothetical protein PAN0_001c0072 [Moesziomyces antarcticus]SPO42397.1 uncharacterized protein PSANT_00080 [Moesziomyces antarcticus]